MAIGKDQLAKVLQFRVPESANLASVEPLDNDEYGPDDGPDNDPPAACYRIAA
jgi:hypothetical protein